MIFGCVVGLAAAEAAQNRTDILKAGKYAFAFARQQHWAKKIGSCGWTRSTYMIGVWEYYAATVEAAIPDKYARSDVVEWGRYLNYTLCTGEEAWTGPCATPDSASCADNQLPGATFIELYKAGLDLPTPRSEATLHATKKEFDAEIALGDKTQGSWPIVDLTYMAMAPLSRLGAVTGDKRYFDKLFANWNVSMLTPREDGGRGAGSGGSGAAPPPKKLHRSYGLWNRSARLFMRDDITQWRNGYWGRGNGWAMLGLVDAIRFGSAAEVQGGAANADTDAHRAAYLGVFRAFAAQLVVLQGSDGAWRSSMLDAASFPTPDATATACFARGLAFGVNAGLLTPASTFAAAARNAWDFLSRVALQPSGKVGYCQPAGVRPAEDFNASSTSDFCVGMFLGAAAEVSKMQDVAVFL